MYTIVKPQQIVKQQQVVNQPKPVVIDHRHGGKKYREETALNGEISYSRLKHERDILLESEKGYKKQLKELQKEKGELLKLYEPTYAENKQLKSIIMYGPDAVKIKRLRKDKRELENELDNLKNDHKELSEQMKSLLNASKTQTRDQVLERQWQTILTGGSNNDPKQIQKGQTQDNVETANEINSSHIAHVGETDHDVDTYDLQIDTVEKEIQILLNNVKQLKNEKKKVDYAMSQRKGAVVGNQALLHAINEKLQKDLHQFEEKVDSAKIKSSELKQNLEENKNLDDHNFVKQRTLNIKISTVKTKFFTVETQTDDALGRAKNDYSPDRLELSKRKKYSKSLVLNRAVQTDITTIEQQKNIQVNISNLNSMASRKNISSTKRRIEYGDKLKINRSYDAKLKIEEERQQDHSKSDGKKTNHQNNEDDKPAKKLKIKTVKATVAETKETQAIKIKKKSSEKMNLQTNSSPTGDQPIKTKATRIQSKSVGHTPKPTELDDFQDKIMDKFVLPKLKHTGYVAKSRSNKYQRSMNDVRKASFDSKNVHTTKTLKTSSVNEKNVPSLPSVDEDRNQNELGSYDRTVSRADTPVNDIPDFDFVVPHKNGRLHYKGKPVTETTGFNSNEAAYDEVLFDLDQRYKHPETNIIEEFDKTYREHKDSSREHRNRTQTVANEPFPSIPFHSDGKTVTETELRNLIKR